VNYERYPPVERGFASVTAGNFLVFDVQEIEFASSASARDLARQRKRLALQQAPSIAIACCGADLIAFQMRQYPDPRRDHLGKLGPVTTAITPGAAFAAAASIF